MILEKLSPNIVILIPSKPPDIIDFPVLRGDTFSFTLIARNSPDEGDFYDLSIYDSFHAEVKQGFGFSKILYTFEPSDFVLGKHESETQSEKDQLSLTDLRGNMYDKFYNFEGELWLDIEAHQIVGANIEVQTLIQMELIVDPEITNVKLACA